MAGSSYIGAQRMQTSLEYAEPRTPPAAQYASSSKAPTFRTPPGRPMVEFDLPGDEPRPILRNQSSNVRISSPLRKQVGFDDKPRLRPVLKSSHSASGSLNGTPDVPRQSLRERRGRARAQVSWAQTIAVPPSSTDYMEEISTARPVNPRRSMDRVSFASSDARSFASSSSSYDGHGRRSADGSIRPALRPSRSLSSSIRTGGGRPHSTTSTTSAGLWFDIPPQTTPHPSTCMPGFPAVEFHDHRPPKFSRDLLRRPGVVMPKPASRPASIATDRLSSAPNNNVVPARQQSVSRPAGLSRQTSVSKQVGGFFSRRLSKRSASHPPPGERESALSPPAHPSQRGPHGPMQGMPTTPRRNPSMGHAMTPQRGSPMSGASMGGSPMSPPHAGAPSYVQWPPQTMPGRFRGSALPPGAGYYLPPGAGITHDGSSYPLPPGAMPTSPPNAGGQMHGMGMPTSIQPPAHVLSPHEAARQALRHYRSSPALRVTSPPHLDQVPEMGLPTQWVERVPPPHRRLYLFRSQTKATTRTRAWTMSSSMAAPALPTFRDLVPTTWHCPTSRSRARLISRSTLDRATCGLTWRTHLAHSPSPTFLVTTMMPAAPVALTNLTQRTLRPPKHTPHLLPRYRLSETRYLISVTQPTHAPTPMSGTPSTESPCPTPVIRWSTQATWSTREATPRPATPSSSRRRCTHRLGRRCFAPSRRTALRAKASANPCPTGRATSCHPVRRALLCSLPRHSTRAPRLARRFRTASSQPTPAAAYGLLREASRSLPPHSAPHRRALSSRRRRTTSMRRRAARPRARHRVCLCARA